MYAVFYGKLLSVTTTLWEANGISVHRVRPGDLEPVSVTSRATATHLGLHVVHLLLDNIVFLKLQHGNEETPLKSLKVTKQ